MELSTLDPDGAVDDNDDAESRDGYRNDSMRSRRGVDEEEEMRLTAYPAHSESASCVSADRRLAG